MKRLDEQLPNFDKTEYAPQEMRQLVQVLERFMQQPNLPIRKVTVVNDTSYDVRGDDEVISVDHTATAAVAITLPPASLLQGRAIIINDTGDNASANNITITPDSGTISNAANYVINTDSGSVTIGSDGRQWMVEAKA